MGLQFRKEGSYVVINRKSFIGYVCNTQMWDELLQTLILKTPNVLVKPSYP